MSEQRAAWLKGVLGQDTAPEKAPAQPAAAGSEEEALQARWRELVAYDEANPAATGEEFEHRCQVFDRLASKLAGCKRAPAQPRLMAMEENERMDYRGLIQ